MTIYVAAKMKGDAARPYAVVDTRRTYLNVVARYEELAQAKRRARNLNAGKGTRESYVYSVLMAA